MKTEASSFDLAEVNDVLSSHRESSSRPWYRSALHVFAQAVDTGLATAIPLVATNYVAELMRGAYSYHFSGYRDATAPLFPDDSPSVSRDYLVGFSGTVLGLAAVAAITGVATQRGVDFLSALGGRVQHAAGITYAKTPNSYGRLAAETVASAAVSALLPGDRTYHPFVAAAVSGVTEGVLAAAARREPDCQLQSPLRVPIGHEVDIVTRLLNPTDLLAAIRDVVIVGAMAGEHLKTNVETPCIDAIDRAVVTGDGRPSITVHGAAGGCEVELISYGTGCAKTSFCMPDDVRGRVPKSGALTLSACYPSSREIAELRNPNTRLGECLDSPSWLHVRAQYPTGQSRSRTDHVSEASVLTAEWREAGVSELHPPLHGPTMQVRSLPNNTVEVAGVGLPNSTMSIVWPDKTRTYFDVPSSASQFADFSVRSPGPQPPGLINLVTGHGYALEVALYHPFSEAHSSTDTHSQPFWKLGAVAATAPLNGRFPKREAHTAAEVGSRLSPAFAEYLRKLPGESVADAAPDREQQRLQAECRNGITALSRAIAAHAVGESTEYAGRLYGLLVRELVGIMGTHHSIGAALNTRPGHLSGVMASHLGERTGAVAKATQQALAQGHGELFSNVFKDGKTLGGMPWLDDFAQFTKKATDRIARQTAATAPYRGPVGSQAAAR